MAQRIKKGDTVRVVAGRDRDKKGTVSRVLPKHGKLIVAGVNIVTRHTSGRQNARQAGKVRKEALIDMSNVMLVDPDTNQAGRVAWKFLQDGTKIRTIKGAQGK